MHKHSENCPICNIYKHAALIDSETLKEIDKLDDLRKQAKSKIEEIKKENEESIKEVGKILEKLNFERLPSGVFRYKKSQSDSHTIAADPVAAFNIVIEGPLSAYDADPNMMSRIEKQLFDLHDGSDEEFTIIEAKLKRHWNSALKIRNEYLDKVRKELNNNIFLKFWQDHIFKNQVKFEILKQKLVSDLIILEPQKDNFKEQLISEIEFLLSPITEDVIDKDKHSDIYFNIYKSSALDYLTPEIIAEIESIDNIRQETEKKILEIKKENESTVTEISKVFEKIDFERLPSQIPEGPQRDFVTFFRDEDDSSNSINLNPFYFFNTMIAGIPVSYESNLIPKIEKELFNLHNSSDEEFTLLETKLKKQYDSSSKIRSEYLENIRKQLNNLFHSLFTQNIISDHDMTFQIRERKLVTKKIRKEIDPQKDIKKQILDIFENNYSRHRKDFDRSISPPRRSDSV